MFETKPSVRFDTTELFHGFPHNLQASSWRAHESYLVSCPQCPLQFVIHIPSQSSLGASQLEHLSSSEMERLPSSELEHLPSS